MMQKDARLHKSRKILALTLMCITGSATVSAEQSQLLASNDLPGVPLSITDPRSGASAAPSEQATEEVQQQAEITQQDREEQLARIRRQLAEQQENQESQPEEGREGAESKESLPERDKELSRIQREITERLDGESVVEEKRRTVTVKPGVNELLTISRGHPNRVVLPFDNPKVRTTTTDAEVTVSGPILYVATASQNPVTIFVSPEGNERVAISLTLVPRGIPPQELNIDIDSSFVQGQGIQFANPTAESWERRTPYVDTLLNVFRKLAKQDMPQGYTLRDPTPQDSITCYAGEDVSFQLGQVVEGHNLQVQILLAENMADQPVEIQGSQCAGFRVLGAAEWPRSILEPGQKTEVFVAMQRLEDAVPEIRRPSLVQE